MLTLAITGFEADPNHVTKILDIKPTLIGVKGEPSRTGKPRTFNGWWLEDAETARITDGAQHADALTRILDQVQGREDGFARLREIIRPTEVSIYGGLYVTPDQQCSVFLDPGQMGLLALYGIGWGVDIFDNS
jgi:hypothetical protein